LAATRGIESCANVTRQFCLHGTGTRCDIVASACRKECDALLSSSAATPQDTPGGSSCGTTRNSGTSSSSSSSSTSTSSSASSAPGAFCSLFAGDSVEVATAGNQDETAC
ncbi:unnamed protein product, partial [Amoebophrya sp. A25]